MKNMLLLTLAAACFLFVACEEEAPYINYMPSSVTTDTTFIDLTKVTTPQAREVLIEDVSGVSCVNCPDAAKIIAQIKSTYPNRVNSITIYPNTPSLFGVTKPVNKPDKGFVSKYELRTEAGGQIIAAFGSTNALPFGYINRKIFAGTSVRYINKEEWPGRVNQEKDSVTPVNINLKGKITGESKLKIDLELVFTKDFEGDYFVTVALLQDSIIDVQEASDTAVGTVYIANYVHMHVLRKTITAYTGDKLNSASTSIVKGRVIQKSYETPLIPEVSAGLPYPPFQVKNLSVIAFVHRGGDNVVVQSKEFEVAE
jgi:hypothetical protein